MKKKNIVNLLKTQGAFIKKQKKQASSLLWQQNERYPN